MTFPGFPKEVVARILDNVVTECDGPRTVVAAGLHGVCRAWRADLLDHAKWRDECVREGVGLIDRPDGVPVDWGAHYMSYAASRETQAKVMEAVMLRKNIFMTGPGGAFFVCVCVYVIVWVLTLGGFSQKKERARL